MDAPSRFEDAPAHACDGSGRPRAVPGAILGRPRRAQSVRESSRRVSGTVPRRSRTVPEQGPSEFGAASCVAHVSGAICCRFCAVARKPRYAFRISFYSVLLGSNKISSERVRAAENVGIRGISISQSEPGSVWATQNRARAAQFERQNAKKTHEVKRFFLWGCERFQLERESALRRRCRGARIPKPPGPRRVISIEIFYFEM